MGKGVRERARQGGRVGVDGRRRRGISDIVKEGRGTGGVVVVEKTKRWGIGWFGAMRVVGVGREGEGAGREVFLKYVTARGKERK